MDTQLCVVSQEQPPYQVGDMVVHPVHGIGVVIRLDEIKQGEQSRLYYVIAKHDKVTVWVPVDAAAYCGMRPVVSASRFAVVCGILSSSAQPLNEQAHERQVEIRERLNQGTLEAICSIVRDLTVRRSSQRLNENDARMLKRTRKLLLDEWVLVMDVRQQEAESYLSAMLHESVTLSSQRA
jgi:CarD family transcriptional regulator